MKIQYIKKIFILIAIIFMLTCIFSFNNFHIWWNYVVADASLYKQKLVTCGDELAEEETLIDDNLSQYSSSPYDSYLQAYFDMLTENFGHNIKGSCSHIALSMVLSYYDNYLNDDIVDEYYDVSCVSSIIDTTLVNNSPGTMYEDYYYTLSEKDKKNCDATQYYYNFVEEYAPYSLHAKLILIGKKYHNSYNFNDDKYPCGTYISDLIRIAKTYLEVERGYKQTIDFWFNYKNTGSSESIKNFVIEQIDLGFPVIVSIGNYAGTKNEKNHACVAFAHDGQGNVYFHTGWHGSNRIAKLEDIDYAYYNEAFTLKFGFSHTHTNNYIVEQNGVSKAYCYCNHDIITYKKIEHDFSKKYVKRNNVFHTAFCNCGSTKIENHTWTEVSASPLSLDDIDVLVRTQNQMAGQINNFSALTQMNINELELIATALNKKIVNCYFCGFTRELGEDEIVPIVPWE